MTSLWLDKPAEVIHSDPFEPGTRYDVVVAGAGLTGLTTALLLARAGLKTAVVEARSVGAVTTGNTTGKLSLLQGTTLSGIRSHASAKVLRAYVEGNRAGQLWLLRYMEDNQIEHQRRDAYSYAGTPEAVQTLGVEYEACRVAGLQVSRIRDAGLPFETFGALLLRDQAQFNPMDVLITLARELRAQGGVIVEETRVHNVKAGQPSIISTSRGHLFASRVVLATGAPILNRGLYFAKTKPSRSYVLAFQTNRTMPNLPQGMYLSVDSLTRSLRTAPVAGDDYLLVGGNGHTVGRHPATLENLSDIEQWTLARFPGAVRTHAWSAQDYESANRIPFVGWMPRASRKIFLATGFNKWGMTNAIAAALSLSADLLNSRLEWATTLHHRITTPRALAAGIGTNAEVVGALARGWLHAEQHPMPGSPLPEGSGTVGNQRLKPVARSTVNGEVCKLSAVCTHLGGIVVWNAAERSWDCPLHGSRFDAKGRLLEGPATRDLKETD